jgi:hypothetical protein
MNYLTYASTEMFSSTDLIRKSKMVFDKISKNEIEKAVILRDGKPSFMLLDFQTYENIMNDYLRLKNIESTKSNSKTKILQDNYQEEKTIDSSDIKSTDDIDEEQLQKALEQIEQLQIGEPNNDTQVDKPLKEFWD